MTYNLSIHCVHGSTYGLISRDPNELLTFLLEYDLDGGSVINLVQHAIPGEMDFVSIDDPDEIYRILGYGVPPPGPQEGDDLA